MWIALERRVWQNPLMEDEFPLSRSKEDIGYRLKLTRLALGYSQALICKIVNIATTTWNNYEKGIRRPSVDEVLKMVSRLHLPIAWVYDGDTSQVSAELLEKIYAEHARELRGEPIGGTSPPSRPGPKRPPRRPFRRG
jgi:transcriptional regulator with XRE-family HTH domain